MSPTHSGSTLRAKLPGQAGSDCYHAAKRRPANAGTHSEISTGDESLASDAFSLNFINELIGRARGRLVSAEQTGPDGGPRLRLHPAADPAGDAGFVRVWVPGTDQGLADRLVHFRLCSPDVDTQLLFLFGRPGSPLPHLHVQVVQFGATACVFNADLLPRLDPVDYPDYFRQVFGPLNRPYWQAVNDYQNICSHAPGNPAIAVYLSPWSIGTSRPSNRAELQRVRPSIEAYLDHWLNLATNLSFPGPAAEVLRARDSRHLACFFDESLDPRAWQGVYRLIGEGAGHEVRRLLMTPHYT